MSKSKGNVVCPEPIVERFGADTARCYILFIGPPDQDADWSDEGVEGVLPLPRAAVAPRRRTLAERAGPAAAAGRPGPEPEGDALALVRKAHWAIDKVTSDMAAASPSTPRSPR